MATLGQRIKAAWRAWQRGATAPWGGSKASFPLLVPAWQQGKPEWKLIDFSAYVDQGYSLNAIIYSAIAYKARQCSAAPLRVYEGDPKHGVVVEDHELSDLIARPNEYQSQLEFQQQATVYLNVAGNNYCFVKRQAGRDVPAALYNLRPDRVFIIPKKDGIKGFAYYPEGRQADPIPILPRDIIHTRLPNPGDHLEGLGYGLSPISPMARNADVDNKVTWFLKKLFDSGLMPPLVVSYDFPLDEDTIGETRSRFREVYGGVDQWTDPLIFGRDGKVDRLGYAFDELDMSPVDFRNETRMLGPFGVHPILVGAHIGMERSTFSNYEEARRAFWEDTFVPETLLFQADYRYFLSLPDEGLWTAFDFSEVPALRKNVTELVDAAYKMWQMGTPAHAAYDAVGLQVPELPQGDTGYLPLNLVPIGRLPGSEPEEAPASTPAGAEDGPEEDAALKKKIGSTA